MLEKEGEAPPTAPRIKPQDADWSAIKSAWVEGATLVVLEQRFGVARSTISDRARVENWAFEHTPGARFRDALDLATVALEMALLEEPKTARRLELLDRLVRVTEKRVQLEARAKETGVMAKRDKTNATEQTDIAELRAEFERRLARLACEREAKGRDQTGSAKPAGEAAR